PIACSPPSATSPPAISACRCSSMIRPCTTRPCAKNSGAWTPSAVLESTGGLRRRAAPTIAAIHRIRLRARAMPNNGPIVIQGIDHVVLRVADVERVQRFYCDVLGCTVEKLQPKIGLTQLRAGRALIDLVDVAGELGRLGGAAPGREGRNMDHVCL